MLNSYLKRGLLAGTVGGAIYSVFVVAVSSSLIGYVEHLEHGHGGHEHAAKGGAGLSSIVADATTVIAPLVGGTLLGLIVFGVAYYFLEPVVPGAGDTKSYVLGVAGFVTLSGSPWVLLPPQPPGMEQSLPTDVRLTWYATMMVAGAAVCGLSVCAYRRVHSAGRPGVALVAAVVPLAALPLLTLVAPENSVTGPIPEQLATAFQAVVLFGQLALWFVLASAHAWLVRRAAGSQEYRPTTKDADFELLTE